MSAMEVIEQIKQLSREDQEKVAAYVGSITTNGAKSGEKVGDEFKRAADEVFKTNTELFRKLAQ